MASTELYIYDARVTKGKPVEERGILHTTKDTPAISVVKEGKDY